MTATTRGMPRRCIQSTSGESSADASRASATGTTTLEPVHDHADHHETGEQHQQTPRPRSADTYHRVYRLRRIVRHRGSLTEHPVS